MRWERAALSSYAVPRSEAVRMLSTSIQIYRDVRDTCSSSAALLFLFFSQPHLLTPSRLVSTGIKPLNLSQQASESSLHHFAF
jgi:hypothetical protein